MSDFPVKITVTGYRIEGYSDDVSPEMIAEAEEEIRSDIAMALAGFGQWCDHGRVTVEVP